MLSIGILILLPLQTVWCSTVEVTFKNVKVEYITTNGLKNTTIESARNLNEKLPKTTTKAVQIEDHIIPVLFKNSFGDFSALFILKLSNNQIAEIEPGAFRNLPKLKSIDLNQNNLSSINGGVFAGLKIENLQLDFNRIERIHSNAFEHISELNFLSINNNRLVTIDPNWFKDLNKLTYLSIAHNLIEAIPDQALQKLPSGTANSSEPLDLFLSNNRIRTISRNIFGTGARTFNWLSLSGNDISEWNEQFLQEIRVAHLDMSSNNLTCLKGDLSKYLVTVETHLDDNPWKCECLTAIVDWMRANHELNDHQEDKYAKMTEERCDGNAGTLVIHRSFSFD